MFISKLGSFPLAGDPFPYSKLTNAHIYSLVIFIYCIFIGFTLLEAKLSEKIIKNRRFFALFIYGSIILFLAVLTYEVRFIISAADAAMFYGPVYEVASGKTIFTQVTSQYGFLSVLFFGLIYTITHIRFAYLPLLIWFMYVIQYFICFILIHKTSKSLTLALLGLFSIVTINYFLREHAPQAGALRWLPLFLGLFLLYQIKKIDSRLLIIAVSILSFWNLDAGLALFLSYLSTLSIVFLVKKISLKQLLTAILFLFLSSCIVIILIQSAHFVFGYQFVDFLKMYQSLRKNAAIGLVMVPMPTLTYFWLFILLYFASLIYVFRNLPLTESEDARFVRLGRTPSPFSGEGEGSFGAKKRGIELSLLVFSANLMFFASIYYVGRSMNEELYTITPFALLIFFLLLGSIYQRIHKSKIRISVISLIFLLFIVYPIIQRKEVFVGKVMTKFARLKQGHILTSDLDQRLNKIYAKESELINTSIKEKSALILSADDTYLFYLTQKTNLLNANPVYGSINMKSEMGPATKIVTKICPQTIAVDCVLLKRCLPHKSFTGEDPYGLPEVLSQVETQCKLKYKPVSCTDRLCIASSK